MASGYVYVLVNSSMPGLVKVGKTTRDPAERMQELSGVTGVPTPFVLAFDSYFANCDAAEQYVHEELQRQGFREASNREFFRASSSDIIRIVLNTPGSASRATSTEDDEDADIIGNTLGLEDEFAGMQFPKSNPWDGILELADSNYFGMGDCLQDFAEALKLYRQAARLGSLLAYEKLGTIYSLGEGVSEDKAKGLSFFKEGAGKGNYYCYCEMASLFFFNDNIDNSLKCWGKFFACRRVRVLSEVEEFPLKFDTQCIEYIRQMLLSHTDVNHLDIMQPIGSKLLSRTKAIINDLGSTGAYADSLLTTSRWIERELLPPANAGSPGSSLATINLLIGAAADRALDVVPFEQQDLASSTVKRRSRLSWWSR